MYNLVTWGGRSVEGNCSGLTKDARKSYREDKKWESQYKKGVEVMRMTKLVVGLAGVSHKGRLRSLGCLGWRQRG